MTNHDFLYFLAAARDFFGLWPDRFHLYLNLRENTPKGQTRWDQQARAVMSRMLRRGLIEWVDCPGPCLKLSRGTWEHMHVDGHPDTDVWQRFHQVNGTSEFWNQNHVGEVVEMRAGMAVNIGKCTVCGGKAKVKCSVCGGTGRLTCPICEGKGFVPETWTAFSNPKQKNPPNLIQLKDGRTIYAKIETRIGSRVYIRTESGKQEELLADDIVSTESAQKR